METERKIRFILRVLRVLIDVTEYELNQRIDERKRYYYEKVDDDPFEDEDSYISH